MLCKLQKIITQYKITIKIVQHQSKIKPPTEYLFLD